MLPARTASEVSSKRSVEERAGRPRSCGPRRTVSFVSCRSIGTPPGDGARGHLFVNRVDVPRSHGIGYWIGLRATSVGDHLRRVLASWAFGPSRLDPGPYFVIALDRMLPSGDVTLSKPGRARARRWAFSVWHADTSI